MTHRPILLATAFTLLTAFMTPAQEAPTLLFPVDCDLGAACFIQQVMDRDPGPDARDFTCGPQSYDGHTGTDIRVADFEAMEAGMTVIIAADGIIRAVRDGVPDGGTEAAPEGQGCGNGVVISHADGWETQYCHLLRGSVSVAQGETVTAGTPLGQIGFSGFTDFPHVEFLVRHNGSDIDPFDPSDLSLCGTGAPALWAEPVAMSGGGILSAGFAEAIPGFDAIQTGTADVARIGADAGALVLWGFVHSGRIGDIITLRIRDASGAEIHAQSVTLERTQAQLFRASGRRTPASGWPPGRYEGEVTLIREGEILDVRLTTVAVD